MNPVKKAIKKYWGKRCGEHHPDCVICQAWFEYDVLVMNSAVLRHARKEIIKYAKGE